MTTEHRSPNIVFFFTDDQRFDAAAALGNKGIHTPNIDRLAERGTTFTQAHIPGGTSRAICMPSRAMLHTGRSLFHLEGAGQRIPDEHATLGETLRNHGYRTFGTGKWHNGREGFHRSFSDGDDIFFGGMADHWNVPVYGYDPSGRYDTALPEILMPRESNAITLRECDHIHAGKHSHELVCDAAIDFLHSYDAEAPFFLYVAFLGPHDPRSMPESFRQMYDPERVELPPGLLGAHPFDNGELRVRDELLCGFPRTIEETSRHIAEYHAMITHLDAEMGRVLAVLEEKGLVDDTIIVFSSDNGLALGQHGLMGKQNCYDHSVRVPLIVSGPGIAAGATSEAFVYLFDIFPTLCELAGIAVPDTVEGCSLVGALGDPSQRVRESLYFAYQGKQRGVKNSRYKLIEYVVAGRHTMTQLFDLHNDPWEQTNLAAEAGYRQVLEELRAEMRRYAVAWDERESPWGQEFWPVFDASVSGSGASKEPIHAEEAIV